MHFTGQTGMQMPQSMQPSGSTMCVRCPVEKYLIVSVGQTRRHQPQLMQADEIDRDDSHGCPLRSSRS